MLCRGEHQFGSTQYFPGALFKGFARDSVTFSAMKVFVEQNFKYRSLLLGKRNEEYHLESRWLATPKFGGDLLSGI